MTYKVAVSFGNDYSIKTTKLNTVNANLSYKVAVSSGNDYSVRITRPGTIKANLLYNVQIIPVNLDNLNDV
jgi:hypothetical protein